MELVRDLQSQHDALSEELFGEGKGLTKIVRDLAALTKFTQPIPEVDMRLKELAETAVFLKKGHQEVAEYCDQNSRDMEQYYNTMEQRSGLGSVALLRGTVLGPLVVLVAPPLAGPNAQAFDRPGYHFHPTVARDRLVLRERHAAC